MIGVAAGLALEGYRPVVHSYAPFLVERPYEQIKLDLGHQDLGAVLVSTGASYDAATRGRTHQAPEDVALLAALPGWTIHVPGHPRRARADASRGARQRRPRLHPPVGRDESRAGATATGSPSLREGSTAPLVLAVGPTLDPVLEATADLDVTVAYLATVRPFDADGLRAALARHRRRPRRAVPRRHLVGEVSRALQRPPAPAARARRAERRVPPLRRGRRAPRSARARRGGHPRVARAVPKRSTDGVRDTRDTRRYAAPAQHDRAP